VTELLCAEMLRRSRERRWLPPLRAVLAVDLVVAVATGVVRLQRLGGSIPIVLTLVAWPLVWLAYFCTSRRVPTGFGFQDWVPRSVGGVFGLREQTSVQSGGTPGGPTSG